MLNAELKTELEICITRSFEAWTQSRQIHPTSETTL